MEIWKDIIGYEGLYQVSNYGNVKSFDRVVLKNNYTQTCKGRVLKLSNNPQGYHTVRLCKDLVQKTKTVHRLVAKAFIENIEIKPEVNHLNSVRNDNRVANLEWCTRQENNKHTWGNLKAGSKRHIKIHSEYVPVLQYTADGVFKAQYKSRAHASRETGVDSSDISNCVNLKPYHNTAGGYIWINQPAI